MTIARETIAYDLLRFDLENPRFGLNAVSSQPSALKFLIETANIQELWGSICEQGFLEFEPMIVKREANGTYTVIEGNRRLAAVQTLMNPSLVEGYYNRTVPTLPANHSASLENIQVTLVASKDEADAFIGYKHVNGPVSWQSISKAKFCLSIFNKDNPERNEPEEKLRYLTATIGDTRSSILRLMIAYKVFEQALSSGYIGEEKKHGKGIDFSHLYTMLPNPDAREYIGLPRAPLSVELIKDNPVPNNHKEKLKFLIGWLFGGSNIKQVIERQGTDRPRLQRVLSDPKATLVLENSNDFSKAVDLVGYDGEKWVSSMLDIETRIDTLVQNFPKIKRHLTKENLALAEEKISNSRAALMLIIKSIEPDDAED